MTFEAGEDGYCAISLGGFVLNEICRGAIWNGAIVKAVAIPAPGRDGGGGGCKGGRFLREIECV